MKTIKILKISLASLASLVLVLVVGVAAIFFFWLGPTVKAIAENIGSKALGTPVRMELLAINPREGTVQLAGFQIGNPDGFGRTNMVSLSGLAISIDTDTVFSDMIVVKEIRIDSPHFVYEQNSATDNIAELIANIQDFAEIDPHAPAKEPSGEPKSSAEDDSGKPPKKVIFESLVINDVQIAVANTDGPQLDIQLTLEQFSLSFTNGVVQLKNLSLSNPSRLATPNVFELEGIDIQLDPSTIYSNNVVIENIHVSSPHAFLENNLETGTMVEFMKLAATFTNKFATASTPLAEEPAPEVPISTNAPAPMTVELHNLVIDDIQLSLLDTQNNAPSGSKVLASIDSISVSLVDGTVQLKNLALGNPGPLATPNVFELEGIDIQLDPASIQGGTVVIEDVKITKPYAFLEQNPETDTVAEFMKLAESFTAQIPPPPAQEQTPAQEPAPDKSGTIPETPPVELRNLYVDDIQIKLLDTTGTNATPETKTLAAIGSISVRLVEGSVQIKGITVPNPAGFTATNLFNLANIDIDIDPASIFSPHVIITEVFVNSPLINLEQTETTGNVSELQKMLEGFIPPAPQTPATPEPVKVAAEKKPDPIPLAGQPVILQTLFVTNFAVNMILPPTTNATVMGEMAKLNPLDRVSFKDLNPMGLLSGKNDKAPATEAAPDKNAPITVIAFDLLTAEPLKGLIQIDNLHVGNPRGFTHPNLASIEHFRIDIDLDTMQTDTLLIKDILIDKPRIVYERQLTTDNIKALQDSIAAAVERREGGSMDKAEPEAAPKDGAEPAGQKIIIAHLLAQGGMVTAKISALPSAPIPLPKIEMSDLGKKQGGTSLGDAISEVYGTFYDTIIGSVSSVTGFAGDALKGAGTLTFGALGTATGGITDNLGKSIGLGGKDKPGAAEETKEGQEPKKESIFNKLRHPGQTF